MLRDLLIAEGAAMVVEVGLAYASSALAIGEALVTIDPPHPRHVVIDPFQESVAFASGTPWIIGTGLAAGAVPRCRAFRLPGR